MSEGDFHYGEVPEKYVGPELLRLGKETFEFCLRHYGDPGRPLKLRWMRKNRADYAYAKILDILKEMGGEKIDRLEQGYDKGDDVLGFVRNRVISKQVSNSVFVAVETPISRIRQVVGHEFYHAQFSPAGFSNQADEKAANRFGERIEREMEEAAKKEAREEWMRRFREIQKSRK